MSVEDFIGSTRGEDMPPLTRAERRQPVANQMTACALHILVECYMMGTDLTPHATAAKRGATNFLLRAGLIAFSDPQQPDLGLAITERGRLHVEKLFSIPLPQKAQEAPGEGVAAPRYVWGYGEPSEAPCAAPEALAHSLSGGVTMEQLVVSIFREGLTWDQQARTLERLGWRRV